MGSVGKLGYSIQAEAEKLLHDEILNNPRLPALPGEINEAAKHVNIIGNALPSIPINWRFAESITALKAFEASVLNVLRKRKYQAPFSEININSDHASLFFMSPLIAKVINKDGKPEDIPWKPEALAKYGFPNTDLHNMTGLHRTLVTNIYRTKDGRYYHVHGSMNSDPSLTALGQPLRGEEGETYDSVVRRFQGTVEKLDSRELDELMNEQYRQAGTICWTPEEFQQSEHGMANAHVGLYELKKIDGQNQPASWWPDNASLPSSASRPLAGLKIVDLTRVIASPAVGRSLAEMGASVMRVTGPKVTDMSSLHLDLNWGKWSTQLDLKTAEGKAILWELIEDADVVIDGYRPGAQARNGFSREAIMDLAKRRGRGIIHVRENCYGWNGPWQHRSGWQQISDACCGVSMRYGQAMGNDEAVTPVFPNSDYCTGVIGCTAVLHALIRRAEEGGSYGVDVSLNYYSQWLVQSVGEYPPHVWNDVWRRCGSPVLRHYHAMGYTLPAMLKILAEHSASTLFHPKFFEARESKAVGQTFVQVKPIAQFADDVKLGYNVGTRGNGVDKPRWPEDLTTEVVT